MGFKKIKYKARERMQKTAILLLALLFIMAAGCQKVGEKEVPLQTEPVVQVECFHETGDTVQLVEAGKNRVAILCEQFRFNGGQDGETDKTFYLIDLLKDEIVSQKEGLALDMLLGIGKNGEIVGFLYENTTVCIYDRSFSLQYQVELPDAQSLTFDKEENCFYFLEHMKWIRLDFKGKRKEIVSLPGATQIEAYDTKRGLLLVNDGTFQDAGENRYTVYSYRENRMIGTVEAGNVMSASKTQAFLSTTRVEENEISEYAVQVLELASGKIRGRYDLPVDGYLTECGSKFGFWTTYGFEIDSHEKGEYRLVDLVSGKAAQIEIGGEGDFLTGTAFLDDDILVCCTLSTDESRQLKLFTVLPEAFDYTIEPQPASERESAEKAAPVPEELKEQRAAADRIEQTYSVQILLGDTCLEAGGAFPYTLISTETPKYKSAANNQNITTLLQELETVLATYPKGFFEKFRNYYDAGGIRIFVVQTLTNPSGEFQPGGVFSPLGGWYDIALPLNEYGETDAIHHELWHAIEERIVKEYITAFDSDVWEAFNPPGFTYSEDFDHYGEHDELFSFLLSEAEKEAYFVKDYSTVNGKEDRATLIQMIFTGHPGHTYYGESTPLAAIRKSPHLKAKLDYLAEQVQKVFGAVYWENAAS